MLVEHRQAMSHYQKDQDGFDMFQKYDAGAYAHDFDPIPLAYKQPPNRPHGRTRSQKKPKLPLENYEIWVAAVYDPATGKVCRRSSAALKPFRDEILGEAVPKLFNYVHGGQRDDFNPSAQQAHVGNEMHTGSLQQTSAKTKSSNRSSKRKKKIEEFDVSDSASNQDGAFRYDDEDVDGEKSGTVSYRADAKEEWEKWFSHAFRAVQQVSCRIIAKEWIKTIHPKKQSTHPYNGKNPRTGEKGDPETTKPSYWPHDVIHKEPDHINKEARTKLLVHLLMHTPYTEVNASGDGGTNREITALTLKESLDQKKLESHNEGLRKKFSIIEQIIEVRTSLEQVIEGGLDPSTFIMAHDYSDFSRGSKADDEADDSEEASTLEDPEGGLDEDVMDVNYTARESDKASRSKKAKVSIEPERQSGDSRGPKSFRKGSQTEVHRLSASSASRKRQQTSQQMGMPHPLGLIHPPMFPPGWDEYQANAMHDNMMSANPQTSPPHDPFGSMVWHSQTQNDLEMAGQFNEHCVMAQHPMTSAEIHPGYRDGRFVPPAPSHFIGMQQALSPPYSRPPAYHPDGSDPRAGHMGVPGQYMHFMAQQSPHHEMMHRDCYPL